LTDTLFSLGLALVLGLLIGVERGWQERASSEGSRIAGIRTFGLIGLLGGLWELLARGLGEILLGIAFLALAGVMVISHVAEAREKKDYGVTTLIAALITFVLGALSSRGDHTVAAVAGVVTTLLLNLKPLLHRWLQRIEAQELTAALKLLLVSVVILPVLPNQNLGPWHALNPYEVWWLVVLIAAISFAAYCAVKIAGARRGILLTGFLGGLVSSTGVSIHLARIAKKLPDQAIPAAGVLVACATMFGRVLLVVAILNVDLAARLSAPMLSMAAALFAAAFLSARQSESTALGEVQLRNPVELAQAVKFGLLLAAVLLASQAAQVWLGDRGLYILAAITGVADVDAITISLARMPAGATGPTAAAQAILLAALVNSATKAVLVRALGNQALGRKVAVPMALSILIGIGVFWLAAGWPR